MNYLRHKCCEKVGLFIHPSGTLPDKTGMDRIRLVVAMVTVEVTLGVCEGGVSGRDAQVDQSLMGGALDGVRVVFRYRAPVKKIIDVNII